MLNRLLVPALFVGFLCAAGCGSSSPVTPSGAVIPTPTPTLPPVPPGAVVWSGTTIPASPSVLASVWKANNDLALLVLWRGTPDWWATAARATNSFGESDSQGGNVVTISLRYGFLTLSVTFDAVQKSGNLQGQPFVLPAGTNVLLVDLVDSSSGPILAGSVSLNRGSTPVDFFNLAPLYRLSPAVVSFLQCDGPAPNPLVLTLACNDIK